MYDCFKEEPSCESKLLPQSKKIQKRRKNTTSLSTSPSLVDSYESNEQGMGINLNENKMHYCVFNAEEKKQVLFLVKKFIIETLHVYPSHQDVEVSQWIKWFEYMKPADFQLFLKRYIPFFRPEMDLDDKKIQAQFFRNIRRWFKSEGKADRRGDPLIPKHDLPRFKKILHEIIDGLRTRKIDELREKILPYLKLVREENGLSFKSNMFQKSKWVKFLQQNPDTRACWEKIPILKRRYYISLKKLKEKGIKNVVPLSEVLKEKSFTSIESNDNIKDKSSKKEEEFLPVKELHEDKIQEDFSDFCVSPILKLDMFCENEMLEQENLKEECENVLTKTENFGENIFQNSKRSFERTYEDVKSLKWNEKQIKQEKIEEKEEFALNCSNETENKSRKKELNYKFIFWN